MATTVDELQVLITANAASFNKQLQAVQRQMDAMGNNTGKMSNAMSASFAKIAAKVAIVGIAVKKAFDGMVFSIRQFGDMEQNLGGAKAIFGNYADYLVDKSQKAYKAMGMSANQYLATANKIGAIMQGSGISQSQSLAMTTKWMERAADQASVMGVSLETAMEAITGAAKGNFMMMDNIGVKMNATTLEAYALSKGIQTSYSEMSEGTKVGLMYQMFMEKTSYAAGNFAKEGATTLNGALATLKASFANLAASLGRGLAPVLTAIANFMNNYVIPAFQAAIPYVVGFMQAVGSAVGYVMSALGSIFGFATGGASETESVMDGVAEAGAEASKSAGGIANSLEEATKTAKKLKGQLAGFDEMNVLQKPEDTSGGDGGGGGGTMPKFDLPKNATAGLKKFGDEASKVAEGVKKAFSETFNRLGEIINPNMFDGFREGIERISTPLSTLFRGVWSGALNQVKDMWGRSGAQIAEGWGKNLNAIISGAGQILNSLGGILESVLPNIQSGILSMTGLFVSVFEQWQLTMAEWGPILTENMTGLITSILDDGLKPTAELIGLTWKGMWADAKSVWDEHGKKITDGIAESWNKVVEIFRKLWDDIITPIWKPFMEQLKKTWEETLRPMLKNMMEFVAKLVENVAEIWNKVISPIIKFLIDILKPVVVGVVSVFTGIIDTFLRFLGGIVGGIFKALGGVIDFLTGIFTGNWKKAWEGVKNIFSGIASTLGAIIKAPINFIIDMVNGFIRGINQIKIPDWVPLIGGKGIHIGEIPKLAKGGLVSSSTIAMIGEAGREVVLPLDRNTGWMDELASKIGNNGSSTPINITVQIGDEVLLEKVINGINDLSFIHNRNMIRI